MTPRARLDEGPEEPRGVAATAPGVVAGVGEDDGRTIRAGPLREGEGEGDRVLDRNEAPAVAGPLGPGTLGELEGKRAPAPLPRTP